MPSQIPKENAIITSTINVLTKKGNERVHTTNSYRIHDRVEIPMHILYGH